MRLPVVLFLAIFPSALSAQFDDQAVAAETARLLPQLVELRHDLHQHPELGNREFRTAGVVERELRRMGLEVRTGVAKTGVIGILKGGKPGRVIAVRADMDGLPVTEATPFPFKSVATTEYLGRETGVSHACGHDIHVTVALGVAEILSSKRAELAGTVVFVFQPAEEGAPEGEEGGAQLMMAEGALDDPKPEVILALHTNGDPPDAPGDWERSGMLSYTPGPTYASATFWRAKIIGRQAHGATPDLGIDAIVVASEVVGALQTVRSRTLNPFDVAVVTAGTFQAGDRHNIISGTAELTGTIRTYSDSVTDKIKERMEQIVAGVTSAAGATYEIEFGESLPVVVNDTALSRRMGLVLERVAGAGNVGIALPETGAEDFSYFSREIPGFYYKLGVVDEGHESGGHHTPTFRADDSSISLGVRSMTAVAVEALGDG